jgi:outer membrane protein assembly factor BamB
MKALRCLSVLAAVCAVAAVTAQSAMAAAPAVTLTPGSGPPGVTLTVKGTGYGATEAVDVYFDSTDMVVASTTGAGAFSVSFKVPASTSVGTHWVSAVGRVSGLSAQHRFNLYENWPEFGYNALGQRANPYETTLTMSNVGNLEEAWSYTTGAAIDSSPAIVNGVVYVGSIDGSVYALNAATGNLKWSAATGGAVISSPAVAGGSVYVGSANGTVYAFNAATGAVKWSDDLSILEPSGLYGSPTVSNGIVYIGGNSGNLYALNASSGFSNWAAPTGGNIESAPVASGGRVYVRSRDGYVYALNAANGSQAWQFGTGPPLSDQSVSNGVAISNGRLFASSNYNGFFSAVSACCRTPLWDDQDGASEIFASPAVGGGAVYQITTGGDLFSFPTSGGAQNYDVVDAEGGSYASPAYANGVLYLTETDFLHQFVSDQFEAVRASDGTVLWSASVGGFGNRSSAAVSDGSVYVGDSLGTLHAYRLNGSLPAIAKPSIGKLKPNHSLHVTTMR